MEYKVIAQSAYTACALRDLKDKGTYVACALKYLKDKDTGAYIRTKMWDWKPKAKVSSFLEKRCTYALDFEVLEGFFLKVFF